jgi:hypothetical protein
MQSPGTHDITANGLIALKVAGCDNKVVSAAWLKGSGTLGAASATPVPAPGAASSSLQQPAQPSTANPASPSDSAAQPPTAPERQSSTPSNVDGTISTSQVEQKDANKYTDSFYVTYAAYSNGSDCRMSLVKGHTSYSVFSSVIGCHIFEAGQTLSGRKVSHWGAGDWIELLWTDKNGKQKTSQYQIRSYRAVE